MALKCSDFDVKAITTVAGNVDLDLATINALYKIGRASCRERV